MQAATAAVAAMGVRTIRNLAGHRSTTPQASANH
jgi:hypothetical protein